MNAIQNALRHPLAERLGRCLIHLLWQGAAVGVVLAGVLWLLRRRSANARYLAACAGLLLMPACLIVTFGMQRQASRVDIAAVPMPSGRLSGIAEQPTTPPASDGASNITGLPVPWEMPGDPDMADVEAPRFVLDDEPGFNNASATQEPTEHVTASVSSATLRERIAKAIEPALPWIVGVWFSGLLALSVWHLGGWIALRRLRRDGVQLTEQPIRGMLDTLGERLGIRRPVALLQSSRVTVPSLIGFLKPVILLPGSVLTGLTPEQLEAVLAHELAHVRRHDYIVNLLQTAIETLLFFHPAMWWISRQIRIERENCCDDLAVAVTDNRLLYAQSLTRLEELRHQTPTSRQAALTLAASGGSLIDRISRVLGVPRRSAAYSRMGLGVTGLSGLLTVGAAFVFLLPGLMSAPPHTSADAATAPINGDIPPTRPADPAQTRLAQNDNPFITERPPAKAVEPKPAAKPIDLGKDAVKVELNPSNREPGGLFAVGSYRIAGQAPDAKTLYEWHRGGKAPAGDLEIVGRVRGHVPAGGTYRVLSFTRKGTNITVTIDYENRPAATPAGENSLYVRARLPQDRGLSTLPPGTYDVSVSFLHRRGKPTIYPLKMPKLTCRFTVPAKGVSAELQKLAETAIAMKLERQPAGSPAQQSTGLNLSNMLKLTGQDDDRRKLTRVHRQIRAGIDALIKQKKTWAICALLDHPNVDVKILAARGLWKLGDPGSVPVLLAAAKRNHYSVDGSEGATLHSVYRGTLKRGLEQITGMQLTPKGLKTTIYPAPNKPQVIRSDDTPRHRVFSEYVDFPKVDAWLRVVYLSADVAPRPQAVVNRQLKSPKDRGTLSDRVAKYRGGTHTKQDEFARVVPLERMPPANGNKTLEPWFEICKIATTRVTTDDNNWLLFRSKQVNDNDRMWVHSVIRQGNRILVTMHRAIWGGRYLKNLTFHEMHAVNLGKLPAGKYEVSWLVIRQNFNTLNKSGWPADAKPTDGKPVNLNDSFTVVAAKPPAPKATVRHVDPRTQLVWIDIGAQDHVRLRTQYRVFANVVAGKFVGRPKGIVEIVRITGPHLSEARIIQQQFDAPIAVGDILRLVAAGDELRVIKTLKSAADCGTLRDAYEKVTGGNRQNKQDMLQHFPPLETKPNDLSLAQWFQAIVGLRSAARYVPRHPTTKEDNWLLFRSKQVNDNDRMCISRVERQGSTFVIHFTRHTWIGDYAENQTYHEFFGVNLGKLPAGQYTVEWRIGNTSFEKFNKRGWPAVITILPPDKQKPPLSVVFNVVAAR